MLIGHIYNALMVKELALLPWFLISSWELILEDAEQMIFREGNRCEDTWLSGLNQGSSKERHERMSV